MTLTCSTGAPSRKGETGEKGIGGRPGRIGQPGLAGQKGQPGEFGIDGPIGAKGLPGTTVQGRRGAPGDPGKIIIPYISNYHDIIQYNYMHFCT